MNLYVNSVKNVCGIWFVPLLLQLQQHLSCINFTSLCQNWWSCSPTLFEMIYRPSQASKEESLLVSQIYLLD